MRLYSRAALERLRDDPSLGRVRPIIEELLVYRDVLDHTRTCSSCRRMIDACTVALMAIQRLGYEQRVPLGTAHRK